MVKYLRIFSYIRKSFLIYDFATASFWIILYMRKILIYFLSVYSLAETPQPPPAFGLIYEGAVGQAR
jgi:hypothetical protein